MRYFIENDRSPFAAVAVALWLLASPPDLAAQDLQPSPPTAEDSIAILQDEIAARTTDRDQLRRMLAALNVVDTVYRPLYPAWLVLDDDLRERVDRVFRQRRPGVPRGSEVVVVTSPDSGQILDLAVGPVHMGRLDTRQAVGDSLGAEILQGSYQRRKVDLSPEVPRTNVLSAEPRYASLMASAFAIRLMFSKGFGLEAVVGREELGYHFWSSGDFAIRAQVYGLKLGALLPFPYGYKLHGQSDPLAIKPTLFVGSTGFSGEYEQGIGPGKAGLRLAVGDLFLGSLLKKAPKELSAYSLHSTAQAFYSHPLLWESDSFTLTGGISFHQVTTNATNDERTLVQVTDKADFTSPLLRVDYTRLGDRLYGGAVQLQSGMLFLSGWVEVVRNFLFLDLKYYAPAFRDPRPWEQRYFFMVSPRIQITY